MKISVVVPVYNEEENIKGLLCKLENQTVLPDEIIVADDGSIDKTRDIITDYIKTSKLLITLLSYNHKGVNTMRHYGTLKATSDIILQTDADVIPPADWIERIINHFKSDNKLAGVSGNVVDLRARPLESIGTFLANKLFHGLGCNTGFRKEYYLLTSGYPIDVPIHKGGDIVLWEELKKTGKCIHDSSIVVAQNSGYKWRAVGATTITSAQIASGLLLYPLSPALGLSQIGGGLGFGTSEIGTQIIPLQNNEYKEDRDYSVNFTGVHHDVWGLIGLLSTLTLDKTRIIKNQPLLYILYGFFTAIIIHHLLTESSGCLTGICLRPIGEIERSYK